MFGTLSVFVFELKKRPIKNPSTSLRAAFFVLMAIGNRRLRVGVGPEPIGVSLFLF